MRALTEALGKEDTPIAFGWIGVSHQIGAGLSTLLAGIIRTQTGSYDLTFTLYGSLCIIAALAALGIGAGHRTRTPLVIPSLSRDRHHHAGASG
jgi:hypothetical protein